jgi:hypothetical protein
MIMTSSCFILIEDKVVYYSHGDRRYLYVLGEFETWKAAESCARMWSDATGRPVIRR